MALKQPSNVRELGTMHASLLQNIAACEEPITLRRASDLIGMSYAQTSRYVQHLVELGLVLRKQSKDDARVHLLSASAKGRKAA